MADLPANQQDNDVEPLKGWQAYHQSEEARIGALATACSVTLTRTEKEIKMENQSLLPLLLHDNQLKRTARAGWVQRGVPNSESVAAHTHGMTFIVMVLGVTVGQKQPIDMAKLMMMATLHDLPEGLTTDIPVPAWRYLPAGSKQLAESKAIDHILADLPIADSLRTTWQALKTDCPEAHLVHDADKLDMYLQAYQYERQTGTRQLAEFWEKPHQFHFAEAQQVYDEIRARRDEAR